MSSNPTPKATPSKPAFETSPAPTPNRIKITSRPIKNVKDIGGKDHIKDVFTSQESVEKHNVTKNATVPPLPQPKTKLSQIFSGDTPPPTKQTSRSRPVGGPSSIKEIFGGPQ